MNDFLDRKLSKRFRVLDYNGDGFIEQIDFELSVTRLAEEFGHESESPARQRLLDLSLGFWHYLLQVADTNTDGRISETEYKNAFALGFLETTETFDQNYGPLLSAIMDIVDQDGDGKLTLNDEIRWTGAFMNLSEQVVRKSFHRLDQDSDGFITISELLEAIRGYYFDESPDSPAYWLLGPLDS